MHSLVLGAVADGISSFRGRLCWQHRLLFIEESCVRKDSGAGEVAVVGAATTQYDMVVFWMRQEKNTR